MDHKDFKRKPGRLRSVIAGAAIAAVSSASISANAAVSYKAEELYNGEPGVTKGVPLDLDVSCPFPLVGDVSMTVKGTALLPNSAETESTVDGKTQVVVNFSAELPSVISEAMNIVDVVGVTGNALANATVVVDDGFFVEEVAAQIVMALGVPKVYENGSTLGPAIPADGSPLAVSGSGAPDVTIKFFDPAEVKFNLNELILDIDTLSPSYVIDPATGKPKLSSRNLKLISYSDPVDPEDEGRRFQNLIPTAEPLGDLGTITCDIGAAKDSTLMTIQVCDAGDCDLGVTAPQGVDFEKTVAVGGSDTRSFTATGFSSSVDMTITPSGTPFSVDQSCSGGNCDVTVTFAPSTVGKHKATLNMNSIPVLLLGDATPVAGGQAELSTTSVDFGGVMPGRTGREVITVTNIGNEDLSLASLSGSGEFVNVTHARPSTKAVLNSRAGRPLSDSEFTSEPLVPNACVTEAVSTTCETAAASPAGTGIPNNCPAPSVLEPGDSCNIAVGYKPDGEGSDNASFQLATSSGDVAIAASGTGDNAADFGFPVDIPDFNANCSIAIIAGDVTATGSIDIPSNVAPGVAFDPIRIDIAATLSDEIIGGLDTAGILNTTGIAYADVVLNLPTGPLALVTPVVLEKTEFARGTDGLIDRSSPIKLYGFSEIPVEIFFEEGPITLDVTGLTIRIIADQDESKPFISAVQNGVMACGASANTPTIPVETIHTINVGDVVDPGELSVSSTAVDFGDLTVGDPAVSEDVTIENVGLGPLALASVNLSGSDPRVTLSDNCGSTLAPTETCVATITFDPTSAGDITGVSLDVTSDGGSASAPVTGSATDLVIPAILSVAPNSLDFGTVVHEGSADLTVTISNAAEAGALDLEVTGLTVQAPFSTDGSCLTSIPAGDSCTVTVTYTTDGDEDADSANLAISANLGDGNSDSENVALTGNGDVIVKDFSVTAPAALGPVVIGESDSGIATVTNTGEGDLEITGANASGPFTVTGSNCLTVAEGATCEITVQYTATVVGDETGTLTVSAVGLDDKAVGLAGSGLVIPDDQDISTNPDSELSFPATEVGETSEAKTVVVSNAGQLPLVIEGFSATGPFEVTGDCSTLPCDLLVTFTPVEAGAATGTLSIASNDPDEDPKVITLSGTGTVTLPADIEVTPTPPGPLAFEEVNIDDGAKSLDVTIANVGDLPLTVSSISVTPGTAFSVAGDCTTVANGTPCVVTVSFDPSETGAQTATLVIASDDADEGSVEIDLTGTGTETPDEQEISVNPPSINFGEIDDGAMSENETVVVTNEGQLELSIGTVAVSGQDADAFMIVEDNCSSVNLGEAGTCSIIVKYTASGDNVPQTAFLNIPSNDSDEPTVPVKLDGFSKGIEVFIGDIEAAAETVDFGVVESSKQMDVVFTNVGNGDFTTTEVSVTGDNFTEVSNDCTVVAPTASCTVVVSLDGTAEGESYMGSVSITGTDGNGGTDTASATVTGEGPSAPVDSIEAMLEGSVDFASGLDMGVNGLLKANVSGGSLADATLGFANTQINAKLSGLPLVVSVKLNAGDVTGTYDGSNLSVGSTVEMNMPLIYVKLFGFIKIPVGGGSNCGPTDPVALNLSGAANGELTGDISLSNFTSCGPLTSMLTRSLSGGGTITVNSAIQE